ncbi:sugar phosphate nucleotidyltransferase [uncultured Methanobrevibacter sp.]|uniref:phosphocholine cytidylyltransferase family protein n=1 Tax=uncultured Methanobrevibacter sp. TaxID=253161 RepID=UPI0026007E7A|nr:sugar phosphate nucleotidyltransferase [uncultured Methanobrevibacter sp.]
MKVIILNSGMGTRLGDFTKDKPKSLVNIGSNETIFSKSISILSKLDVDEFIITTGYLNDILKEYASTMFPDVNFKFIHNPLYDKTNYIKSIDLIPDLDDNVILLHGDLVFEEQVAECVINSKKSCVIIDSTIKIPDDDFKAKITNNEVKYIGVDYFENDAVACQPFYKLKKEDWALWKNKIREFCDSGNTNVYAENALNTLTDEIIINAIDIKGQLCMEIDTKEDLAKVKEILG